MDDKGEKIVFLARELLSEGLPEIPAKNGVRISVSFKALCLTAILAAGGGAYSNHWVSEHERPLNRYEKVEINALLFYVARLKGVDEDVLKKDAAKEAGLQDLDDLTVGDFAAVRHYLQERAQ